MKNKWVILPKINDSLVEEYPEYDRVVLQLLFNRGLMEEQVVKQFLDDNYEKYSHNPFLFKQMDKAVDLVIRHIKERNKIVIYGDFDADGVTSSAVLFETLSILKAETEVYIPDRIKEGHGLNKNAIDEFVEQKIKLIITVDNGIRSRKEVEYAESVGLDVLITDHHQPSDDPNDLPNCLIINPMSKNEKYPFKYLAGVGVAFKLAKALISKSKLKEDDKEKLEQKMLDLAAIGTVADCVKLTGENRVLVKQGLKVINQKNRIGLIELMRSAQINKLLNKIKSWNIGWQIAPRLNVAGRLDHANTAYELLITKNQNEAQTIARRLNDKNIERQKITNEIVEHCKRVVNKELINDKIFILVNPSLSKNKLGKKIEWPDGVIGLVAGILCRNYNKPALVITKTDNMIKGSGRSIPEFNLMKAIEKSSEFLDKFGGHIGACGFSIDGKENLGNFIKQIKQVANDELRDADLSKKIIIDAQLCLLEVNEALVENINKFEPFGQGNSEPIFVSNNVKIIDIVNMGIDGKHIKFRFDKFWAVAFNKAEEFKYLKIGDKINVAYYLDINEFNGRREVQLKVVDINIS